MTTNHAELNALLADYQVLYQKLRAFHWNVTGPLFFTLHAKFEELYNEVSERVDELAERIATVGGRPISTLAETLRLTTLVESGDETDGVAMVREITVDLESIDARLRTAAQQSEEVGDDGTADLLRQFAESQQKTRWMLRAFAA